MQSDNSPEIAAYCVPCQMTLALPITAALRELIRNSRRPYEPITVAAEVLSSSGEAHSICVIPTGNGVREPGAYIEFAAEHPPYWMQRNWLPITTGAA